MTVRPTIAIRPGEKIKIAEEVWKVVANDTLNRTLDLKADNGWSKRVKYPIGHSYREIS